MFHKILGSLFIIVSTTFISKSLTDSLKRRAESLKAFERLLVLLESEIDYANNPLDVAFSNISNSVKLGGFLPFIISKINSEGIKSSWQQGIENFKKDLSLKDGDIKVLLSLSYQLGLTDRENQIMNIRYVKSLLASYIDEADQNSKTLTRLYRNISFLAGIGTIILLL